ncbi:tetratricopeptide repeat protein [Streptomyces sp. CoT10]|uniref:ATP-binding protein n=1 Tax=Streptomyces sp. CoT10 TaxID=2875762 RepID=UPI001CD525AE|nr:tetratricopeptide repeat protein [Streptomyces sp. CoT10]
MNRLLPLGEPESGMSMRILERTDNLLYMTPVQGEDRRPGPLTGPTSGSYPTFHQLRLFLLLVEEQHFGRAAARAFLSQPAFSKQIRALEDRLGVCLAERGKGPFRLTAAGHALIPAAESTLETHARMQALAGAADDSASRETPQNTVWPVPRQLPAGPGDFTGRERELAVLAATLRVGGADADRPTPVLVVTGPGGVGKTSVAVRAALDARDAFPDGQLYVEIGPGDREADVAARLLRALGVGGGAVPEPAERAALYRSLVADRRLLVVFDNVTSENQVARLVPTGTGSAVLLTSRHPLTGLPAARRLTLGALPPEDARRLLVQIVGADRLARESATADELLRLCGGLPLALRIAAARLAGNPHWTVGRFVSRLADEHRRLDELRHRDLAVRASVNLSYQVLGPRARRLLAQIGLLDVPDFASWTATVLLECDIDTAEDVLDELLAAHMLEVADPGHGAADGRFPRCRCHDLVRLFAREQAERELPPGEDDAVLVRALGAWLYLAERADAALPHGYFSRPGGGAVRHVLADDLTRSLLRDPLAWFDAERAALAALIAQATATGRTTAAWELAASLVAFYEFRAHYPDWGDTHRRVLDVVRAAGDRLGTAVILRGLGELYTGQDRIAESITCFRQARAIFVELGEEHSVAVCDNGLGHMYRVSGRYQDALDAFSSAARASACDGSLRTQAYALHCSGVTHLEQGRLTEAQDCFRTALTLASASGFRRGEAQSERGLGLLCTTTGELDQAQRHLSRALEIAQELGEPCGEANALQMLADVLVRQRKPAQARPLLHQCLRIYDQIGEPFGRALTLHTLGELLQSEGRSAHAVDTLLKAAQIWAELGTPLRYGRTLRAVGDIHAAAGDLTEARATWERALELLTPLATPEVEQLRERLVGQILAD